MSKRWWPAIVVLVVAVGVGWWRQDTVLAWLGVADEAQSRGDDRGVNLTEVSDNPQPLFGRTVVVSATVESVLGPNAMIIGNDTPLVGDEVLVVSGRPLALREEGLREGVTVRVSGEVRPFDVGALEASLAVDLPESLHYSGPAVIAAHAVATSTADAGPGDTEEAGPSAAAEVHVAIDDLLADTARFLGRTVTVSAEVEAVDGPYVVILGDQRLLTVGPHRRRPFVEATAVVSGEAVRFSLADAEKKLGIDLDDDLRRFEGQVAVLIDELRLIR